MAVKDLTLRKVNFNSIETLTFEAATAAADGCKIKIPRDYAAGEYLIILAKNTGNSAYDVSVKAPTNGSYAAADADLKLEDVVAGATVAIRVETARYANNDGTIIVVPENVDVTFAVIY